MKAELESQRKIRDLDKQKKDLQGKFDREVNDYWECFKLFRRDFGEHPKLAWNLAKQFEHHLRQNMRQQGLELGPRIGNGGFGVVYKAMTTRGARRSLCVKIPLGLEQRSRRVVFGSLTEEINYLKMAHRPWVIRLSKRFLPL